MSDQKTYVVFGATGQTGQHFVALALSEGHKVRALARTPAKLAMTHADLQVSQGSVTDALDLDGLLDGADLVISMLGDVSLQRDTKINSAFVKQLVPAMRREGVKRFLYQAGALSSPPGVRLSPALWAIRKTIGSSYNGQHEDNEAVMTYLADEAPDIEWMVHRAGIGSNGASKGTLERSTRSPSIATFGDCAAYNYATVSDASAVHTMDFSHYRNG